MKKTITLLLTLGLLLGLLPVEAAAFAGDIYRAGDVKQVKMADGSLSLQNGYVHVTLHKLLETYSYLTVVLLRWFPPRSLTRIFCGTARRRAAITLPIIKAYRPPRAW